VFAWYLHGGLCSLRQATPIYHRLLAVAFHAAWTPR
jgi:hypothetical protein